MRGKSIKVTRMPHRLHFIVATFEPGFEMLDDEFAVVGDSKRMDLVHETYQYACIMPSTNAATPYRFHVLLISAIRLAFPQWQQIGLRKNPGNARPNIWSMYTPQKRSRTFGVDGPAERR
jgi:hypothetical protein